jgi:regulator of RNase E activity RraA
MRIRANFERPPEQLVAAFKGAQTGHVVDAMGRHGAIDAALKPLTTAMNFTGVALTVWTVPRDNLTPYAALKFARPGDILIIATGGADEASVFGDIAVGMARNTGIAAVVTDGLVRDIDGMEAVGIPVIARGLSPNSPFKNGPGIIGGKVSLGRVAIDAGDIIIGDRDGVVVVPRADAEAVRKKLAAVREKERSMEAAVASGAKYPAWVDGILNGDDIEMLD